MTHEQMVAAFNEWMRRYTEDPDKFEAEFATVMRFLADGKTPSYGETCAAYMRELAHEDAQRVRGERGAAHV